MMNESNPNVIINDGTNAVAVKAGTATVGGGVPGALDAAIVVSTSPNSPELSLLNSIAALLRNILIELRVHTTILQVGLSAKEKQNEIQLREGESYDIDRL